jgi:hypothetical protein
MISLADKIARLEQLTKEIKIAEESITSARMERTKLQQEILEDAPSLRELLQNTDEQERSARSNGPVKPVQVAVASRKFGADSPPNLKHAKLKSAKFNGVPPPETTWNGLLVEAIRQAKASVHTTDEFQRLVASVNFMTGKKEDEGYHYSPDMNLSVQYRDANTAWKGAYDIASRLGVPIEAEFQWRAKDGAAFPGEMGRLSA